MEKEYFCCQKIKSPVQSTQQKNDVSRRKNLTMDIEDQEDSLENAVIFGHIVIGHKIYQSIKVFSPSLMISKGYKYKRIQKNTKGYKSTQHIKYIKDISRILKGYQKKGIY